MNFHSRNRPGGNASVNPYKPSLDIGLLRPDPWNEFVNRPVRDADLLEFNSLRDTEMARLNARIRDNLTVVLGERHLRPLPVAQIEVFSPTSVPGASLAPATTAAAEESIPSVSTEASVAPRLEAVSIDPPSKSIWESVTGFVAAVKKTSMDALPGWFSTEIALVPPTDAEIRARLGSIYGGDLSQVKISVRVIEAVDVPVAHWWGGSDPYVAVCLVRGVGGLSSGRLELLPTVGRQQFSTTRFGTLNPKWNETIEMDSADLMTVVSESVLHVSLWDKDLIAADSPMGFTTISLLDTMQACGVAPYPLIPIQMIGSLVGPHAGLFVKISLRMVKKVGVVSVTPVALQGFSSGWKDYAIRVEAKVVETDPIASRSYVSSGLCSAESSVPAKVNATGHAIWPQQASAITLLFNAPKKSKPFLHITLKSDGNGPNSDPGQVSVRIGLLERLAGVAPLKLQPLAGSPPADSLAKCSLYCGVECGLVGGG